MPRLDAARAARVCQPLVAQIVNVLKVGCQYPDVISLPWYRRNLTCGPAPSLIGLSCVDAEK